MVTVHGPVLCVSVCVREKGSKFRGNMQHCKSYASKTIYQMWSSFKIIRSCCTIQSLNLLSLIQLIS